MQVFLEGSKLTSVGILLTHNGNYNNDYDGGDGNCVDVDHNGDDDDDNGVDDDNNNGGVNDRSGDGNDDDNYDGDVLNGVGDDNNGNRTITIY